ncbi:MAG: helix-turn-helix domain-containing protein [Clostridia bacterium]|nr:helix-turn-helix domain-containing protein [Clostridia bacterium]
MEIKVGEIIKLKREERDFSLVEFSKKVGISPGYLSQLENGHKANPKLEIVLRIIRELDIDIDMLLGIERPNENINLKIPSLLKLVLAKDRNFKVLEDKEALKKLCNIIDKALESKYLIEDKDLYEMFLEDIYIQIETTLKRYMAFQIVKNVI